MEKTSCAKLKCNKQEKERNVQAYVRVRPMNGNEKSVKSYSVVSCMPKEVIVKERPLEKHTRTFCFDKVFGPESSQVEVYKTVVCPLIDEVLAGYNCTVFAYGQTGTGKTFTMEGEKSNDPSYTWENDPLSGIIPRAMSHLFDKLSLLQAEYTVRVSFLELYNEELFDLLSQSDDASKLRLFEDTTRKGSVIINGLEELTVPNKYEVYKILEKGSMKRVTAATLMNAQSSRSHTVFSITVHIKDNSVDGEELLKTGKLNLVDLAGSENIGRSGAVDRRAREASNINQSLLTLGRVITSLVEHAPHVPYRESKLTRLLQDSLGGRTKTSIIATVSPSLSNLEETLSTLDYAHRAKHITNKPEINQKLTKRALLKEYTEEIERLRRDLEATREGSGVYLAHENYTHMVQKLEVQDTEINEKVSMIKIIKEEMEKKEALSNILHMKLDKAKDVLHKTITERDETKYLCAKHVEVEEKLTNQALELQAVVSKSTSDMEKLYKKLETKKTVQEMNMAATTNFAHHFLNKNNELENKISDFDRKRIEFFREQQLLFQTNLRKQEELFGMIRNSLSQLDKFGDDLHLNSIHVKEKNIFYQESLDKHRQNVTSLVQSSHKGLKKIVNIKGDLNSLMEYMQLIQNSQLQLKDNMIKSNQTLTEMSQSLMEFKTSLVDIQSVIQNTSDFYNASLQNIKASELKIHNKRVSNDNELRRRMVTFEDNMKNMFEECMRKMFAESSEIKNMISNEENEDSERKKFKDTISAAATEMNYVNKSVQQHVDNLVSDIDTYNDRLLGFKDTVISETNHSLELSGSNINESKLANQKAQKKLEKLSENQSNSTSTFEKQCSSMYDGLSPTIQMELEDQEHKHEEMISTIQSSVCHTGNLVDKMLSNHTEFFSARCQEFKLQCEEMSDKISAIGNIINQQSNKVQNYVNCELQCDPNTGQTPPRQKFQYPEQLVMMSPYENIINRYWKDHSPHFENIDLEVDSVCNINEYIGDKSSEHINEDRNSTIQSDSSNDKIEIDSDKTSNDGDSQESIKIQRCVSLTDISNSSSTTIGEETSSISSEGCSNTKRKKQDKAPNKKNFTLFKKPYEKRRN